jgi:predicted amidohydrolase
MAWEARGCYHNCHGIACGKGLDRADTDELRVRAALKSRQGHRKNRGGCQARRANRLYPGAVRRALPVSGRGSQIFRSRRADSRSDYRRARRRRQGARNNERRAAGVYHNTAAVIDEAGKIVGRYRKMHIPDDPRYYEKFYFTPGDLDFVAHPTSRGSVGVLVCWDQWFPEAARLTAMAGAQILFYPTAIGWWHNEPEKVRPKQVNAWETIQRSHAIANGIFVAAVNRVGVEGELEFWGDSFVVDPFGEIIGHASATAEETLVAECDLAKIEEVRRNWPFLRDRRIDAYADLTRRYRS